MTKEIVLKVMYVIWELLKRYGFEPLTDEQWENLINEVGLIYEKFNYMWVRIMLNAVVEFYESLK